jgi:ribosomal protein S18 acetylase RimI-like enzyme
VAAAVSPPGHLSLPVATGRHRLEQAEHGIRIIRLSDSRAVGDVVVEMAGGVIDVVSVCIDEDARGYGAGTDAVRLLLAAASSGCRLATASAPPGNGLAVYFWSRMGFRPRFGKGPRGLRFERELH